MQGGRREGVRLIFNLPCYIPSLVEGQAGTQGKSLMQKHQRNNSHCLAPKLTFSHLSYIAQVTCPGMALPTISFHDLLKSQDLMSINN